MSGDRPLLAITMGDPGGIGPEVCAKALASEAVHEVCRPLVVGDAAVVADAVRFCGLGLAVRAVGRPAEARYQRGTIDVLDLHNLPPAQLRPGQVTAEQGRASFEYVARAIELAREGLVDANVTGPISKAAVNAAGFHYAGHTEIYAEKTGSHDYALMLVEGRFRVVHVSTHVSLRRAIDAVRTPRVLKVIELAHAAVGRLNRGRARLAVAGLNPHCGEGGLFGSEDDEQVAPAVRAARERGIEVEGPLPADTVFPKLKGGQYDAVVAMYHDQGHVPVKLLGFHYDGATGAWTSVAGVNVTLGLPIIRTSVDHGTAFDRAGQGTANAQSMIDAIQLAATLVRSPR
ncbi:MAG TPA: 4-hydroxythreonine-4-phosphate dehydrogenase PdxA [Vicinamibacteria bacterium]|nr:4-hydroxythreonine-4-phosphate dehydrogenase PdxA [Vicinamibacteria bacterium]